MFGDLICCRISLFIGETLVVIYGLLKTHIEGVFVYIILWLLIEWGLEGLSIFYDPEWQLQWGQLCTLIDWNEWTLCN
jgi:hypothetical protein